MDERDTPGLLVCWLCVFNEGGDGVVGCERRSLLVARGEIKWSGREIVDRMNCSMRTLHHSASKTICHLICYNSIITCSPICIQQQILRKSFFSTSQSPLLMLVHVNSGDNHVMHPLQHVNELNILLYESIN